MPRRHLFCLIVLFGCLLFTACQPKLLRSANGRTTAQAIPSIIRVTVTSQGYNFHRPWQQRRPRTQEAIGVVVPGGRILVNALLVANHRYIELETLDTQKKQRAEVDVVDYEANLALLKPVAPDFLTACNPLQLAEKVKAGDILTIWQVKPNGDVVPGRGRVTSVDLTAYSQDNRFLAYRLASTLQYRFDNLTLPVVKNQRLAGLVLRDTSHENTIDVISVPVIRHFLSDAQKGFYQGFPMAGFHFGPLLDPQLRRYISLPPTVNGIYVQKIIKGGPAFEAGLKAGDVITRIGDYSVSNSGTYAHPVYGKTSISHLIRTGYFTGDPLPVQVFRQGKFHGLHVVLDHRRPEEYLVPPYIIDAPPDYLVIGGLVLQELSMSYLREYGKDWRSRAPIHLLYHTLNQDYLNGDAREKIVILSGVIETPFTIGFENLSNLVVRKINGRKIGKLSDATAALQHAQKGFHKLEFEQHPRVIYLDPAEIPRIHHTIKERYRIPIEPR